MLCLDAIWHHTNLPYEVLVHDNASEDNTDGVISTTNAENVRYTKGENKGINHGWNWCVENAKYDHCLLLHTDMVVMPAWDDRMCVAVKKLNMPWQYLACCRSMELESHVKTQVVGKDYGMLNDWDWEKCVSDAAEMSMQGYGQMVTAPRQPLFFHKRLWDSIGGFDEKLFSYGEEDDKILAAWNVGVRRFPMVMDSLVYHFSGKTNKKQSVDRDQSWPYEYIRKKYKDTHPNLGDIWQYQVKLLNYYSEIR